MSFAQTFHDLRRRRRLPYTAWRPVEISPPYVSEIEKSDLIPSEERLERLATVFVDVAREQGAAHPEEDARLLYRERDRTFFTERAKIEPDVADVVVSVRELVREANLDQAEREDVLDALQRTAEALTELDPDEREQLVETLDRTLEGFEGNGNGDGEAREGNGTR